jgi:hypothetical protein
MYFGEPLDEEFKGSFCIRMSELDFRFRLAPGYRAGWFETSPYNSSERGTGFRVGAWNDNDVLRTDCFRHEEFRNDESTLFRSKLLPLNDDFSGKYPDQGQGHERLLSKCLE